MSSSFATRWQRMLANTSLPVLSLLVGLICGVVMWLLLDPIQDKRLEKVFHDDLVERLDIQALETRQRFEEYLMDWQLMARDLANHWRIRDYLKGDQWHRRDPATPPIIYSDQPPVWLESDYPSSSSLQPDLVILIDRNAIAYEVFEMDFLPIDLDRVSEYVQGPSDGMITLIDQQPYLLVWSRCIEAETDHRARLLLVTRVDDRFLSASQSMVHGSDTLTALADANTLKLLAISKQDKIRPGTFLNTLSDRYLLTSQAISGFQSADHHLLFTTMVPRDGVRQTILNITKLAQQDRFLTALVYVVTFSLIFALVSLKISHVLLRISRFGQQALGVKQPVNQNGNQLLHLEEWVKAFFRQLITAREELRSRQEMRIRETEALKSALFDNSMVSIVTLNQEGLIVEVNGTAFKTFGFKRDQMLGQRLESLAIHPDDRARFRIMLRGCISQSAPSAACRAQPMRALTQNGEEKSVECSVISIHLQEQTVFNVYLDDVTDKKQVEREIASLAKLASENPSPVMRVNERGVIVYANAACEPLLKYWDCERGQTLPVYWRNLISTILSEGRTKEYELNLEEQIFSLQLAPIRELDYVNIYGRDFTQVRMAEMQSRQHQSELVHVCRLSTMGEMSTGLAHELNQPLSAIVNFASGCVRRLQSGIGGEAELVDAMAQITAQAERAGEIIKRLRALVSKRPQEHEVVNLNHLVLEVASFIEFEANRNRVQVSLELSDEVLPVKVDLVQIEQVMLNLVRNAIDAMKAVDSDRRQLILLTQRLSAREVQVMVQDSGAGIPDKALKHLFDAFFSTKKEGMGMGLSISRKIAQDHKGILDVSSKEGQGATFRLVLPTDPTWVLPGF
ncbi:MAG: ATP-binding protein [Candidatus Thiodiazotropha sp.]